MHPDPVHRAPALGEPVHGGHPLGVWEVAMGVSDQRAGVTILTFNNGDCLIVKSLMDTYY